MINADELFPKNREEYLKFLEKKEILPIDDILLYNGTKYRLTKEDMQMLNLHRVSLGYNWNYSGPEKNPGDAQDINCLLLAALDCIKHTIDNHIEHNCLEYEIIG